MSKINCPSCNTEFEQTDAPWLKQVEYCTKHDRTRLAGTLCEFCEMPASEPAQEPDTVSVAAKTDTVSVAAETGKKSRK